MRSLFSWSSAGAAESTSTASPVCRSISAARAVSNPSSATSPIEATISRLATRPTVARIALFRRASNLGLYWTRKSSRNGYALRSWWILVLDESFVLLASPCVSPCAGL